MATFVIVHGGWGGGWEWTSVARALRDQGHEVFTPTLTGLGERAVRDSSDIGLADHVDDVVAVLAYEDLHDVVLCGHSYSGMVVTGVADRVPERIRLVVYVDAFVPDDGQALFDLVPREFRDTLVGAASERGVPIPPDLLPEPGTLDEGLRTGYVERLVPHPTGTMTEPVRLAEAVSGLARAFVRCTLDDAMEPFGARARSEGWFYRELATPHDPQLFDPDGTAAVLDDLAAQAVPVAAPA